VETVANKSDKQVFHVSLNYSRVLSEEQIAAKVLEALADQLGIDHFSDILLCTTKISCEQIDEITRQAKLRIGLADK
jgi:hypothetical protein